MNAGNPVSPVLPSAAKLTVRATGVRNAKGKVMFAIYDNQKTWAASEKDGKPLREVGTTIKGGEAVGVFDDLPPGIYAVQLHHHEDADGKFDTNMLEIPKEGYGMSNNPNIGMSMPKFDACKFEVRGGEQTINIKMKY